MQNEIQTTIVTDVIKKIGKQFLNNYKKNEIPIDSRELISQLTEIETKCFDFLKTELERYYPGIHWVEDDEFDSDSQRKPAPYSEYWLCDTMDGAIQYLQHLPGWTINLVLIRNEQPYFSVIYDPLADELFWAKKGEGAFMNDSQISPSKKNDKSAMVVVFEYGHQDKKGTNLNQKIGNSIVHLLNTYGVVRNYGPHALQLAYVGAGRIDLFLQEDLDTHNWLAGILIAKEAGAEILTTDGQIWKWGDENLLVAKKDVAEKFIESKF